MFAIAARHLGYGVVVLDPDPAAPAAAVAEHLVAAYDDEDALSELASRCAAVTTEFENPPAAALERLAESVVVAPSSRAVAIAQDRIAEKSFLADTGVPVGPWAPVRDEADLAAAAAATGLPAIIQTARLGYDGKGQRTARTLDEMRRAHADLGRVPCVAEAALELDAEVSVVAARTGDGAFVAFPVGENRHVRGILDMTVVPARVDDGLADEAVEIARSIADALDYRGVLAVELFVVGGRLSVNEIAPRPHNRGHWTLDACADMIRPMLALYAGGMGAKGQNFHFDVFARMGYEAESTRIQEMYLAGNKKDAIAAVPLSMVEDVALVGPMDKIRDELPKWKETCLTTFLVSGPPTMLNLLAELLG